MSQILGQHDEIMCPGGGRDGDILEAWLMSSGIVTNLAGNMGTSQIEWQQLIGVEVFDTAPPFDQSARLGRRTFALGLGYSRANLSSGNNR